MLKEIIEQVKPRVEGTIVYLSQFGSHLYGLNTENSDIDFRGIYIPSINDLILHKDKDEINTELEIEIPKNEISVTQLVDDYRHITNIPGRRLAEYKKVDVKLFSLQKFIQLCSKADTNALDLLFSVEDNFIEKYIEYNRNTTESVIWQLYSNRSRLINTNRLESPITYAFKQATKYGLKGERLRVLQGILTEANNYLSGKISRHITLSKFLDDYTYRNGKPIMNLHDYIDGKHVKIDVLDNKGKEEKYLYVCGVQHQFNLELDTFIERIEEKINKEYTSQRTIDAKDGNDWKALSHAVRVLLEVQELMETGTIRFPLRQKDLLLNIKLGKIDREAVDEYFKEHLSGLMECIEQDTLGWKYDEDFWNKFIVRVTKSKGIIKNGNKQ